MPPEEIYQSDLGEARLRFCQAGDQQMCKPCRPAIVEADVAPGDAISTRSQAAHHLRRFNDEAAQSKYACRGCAGLLLTISFMRRRCRGRGRFLLHPNDRTRRTRTLGKAGHAPAVLGLRQRPAGFAERDRIAAPIDHQKHPSASHTKVAVGMGPEQPFLTEILDRKIVTRQPGVRPAVGSKPACGFAKVSRRSWRTRFARYTRACGAGPMVSVKYRTFGRTDTHAL